MLDLSHSRAAELPPSTNANYRLTRGFYVLLLSTYVQMTKACKRDFTYLNSRKSLETRNLNLDFKKAIAFSRSKNHIIGHISV